MIRRMALGLLLSASLPIGAQDATTTRPAVTSAADLDAIVQVSVDFRSALSRKDVAGLSSLLVSEGILFASPPSPAAARARRERGAAGFTGAEPGGFPAFAAFIAGSQVSVEERFYNLKVSQDGHLAWLSFDFEFLLAGKIENYGVESWQLLKTADERWKIMSVVWSSHGAPR